MCSRSPIAATINATTRKVIPAQRRLPVRKNTRMAARAAMGKANRMPTTTITIKAMMRRTIRSHRKPASVIGGITWREIIQNQPTKKVQLEVYN